MFDGRHCLDKDLDLLIKETRKVKSNLSHEQINLFLKLISRFDSEIAEKMAKDIKACVEDNAAILKAIDANVDVLKQNVIVDINEHR